MLFFLFLYLFVVAAAAADIAAMLLAGSLRSRAISPSLFTYFFGLFSSHLMLNVMLRLLFVKYSNATTVSSL